MIGGTGRIVYAAGFVAGLTRVLAACGNADHLTGYFDRIGWFTMVLIALVTLAVVTQVVIMKTWSGDDEAANLLGVWIWYAISVLNVIVVGLSISKLLAWLYISKLRPGIYASYRHWSMEKEVENLVQAWLHIPMLVLLALWSFWTLGFALSFMPAIVATTGFLDTPGPLVLFWPVAFLASTLWVLQEHDALGRKRRELAGLRQVYHQRFPVSELLSMYECLRVAPRVFWEEYKDLPAVQVNETTNRRFRERAAPYSSRGGDGFQRKTLIVAGVAVLVAALTFIETSIDGGSVAWFVQGLTK